MLQGQREGTTGRAVQEGFHIAATVAEATGRQGDRAAIPQASLIAGAAWAGVAGVLADHAFINAGSLVGGVGDGQGHGKAAGSAVVVTDLLATGHVAITQGPVPGGHAIVIAAAAGIELAHRAAALGGERGRGQAVRHGTAIVFIHLQKAIGGLVTRITDHAGRTAIHQRGENLLWAGTGVGGQIQGGGTGGVGRCHGGAVQTCGLAIGLIPGRGDVATRRKQIHTGAEIGKRGALVRAGGGPHGQSLGHPVGRAVTGVGVVVTGGHHHADTGGHGVTHRSIQGAGRAAAQGHIGHRGFAVITGHPVHPGDHAGVATATVTAQDTHGGNLCLLGHPVNGAHGGAGHMGAVAITVVGVGRVHAAAAKQEAAAAADEVTARADPPAEFGVAGAQAGVDHINGDIVAGAVGILIAAVQGQCGLIHPVQAPGGICLGGDGLHATVRFQADHSGHQAQQAGLQIRQPHGHACECMLVGINHFAATHGGQQGADGGGQIGHPQLLYDVRGQGHNILIINDLVLRLRSI